MLHVITSVDHPLLYLLNDDPVRPEIPHGFRVSWPKSAVFVNIEADKPTAVVCVSFTDFVPKLPEELFYQGLNLVNNTVIFYTIWSYVSGHGAPLIRAARDWILANRPEVTQFITLSPPTEMAQRFHLRNGASVFRHNGVTVNYQY